jgi:hypothetical protein
MRNLKKYSLILEDTTGNKEYTYEKPEEFKLADPTKSKMYKYAYFNGDWWAKNTKTGVDFNISKMSNEEKFKKFQKSIDILNKEYLQDRSANKQTSSATNDKKTKEGQESESVKKGLEIYKKLVNEESLYQRKFSGGRVWVYKGSDLSEQDRDALASYMQTLGYRLSKGNFDFREGEKLVFKRSDDQSNSDSSKKEESSSETAEVKDEKLPVRGDSTQDVNKKVMRLIKSKRIKFDKYDESTKKGIVIYRILLETTTTNETDLKTIIDYFDRAGYKPFPEIANQIKQEKERGDGSKSYVFALKDVDVIPEIDLENSASCFFHFYYKGELKKRLIGKKWKIKKGVELSTEQQESIEEIANALNPNLKIKESRLLDYKNFISLR